MNTLDKKRILVLGWMPPPFNGRTHAVMSVLRPPFTHDFAMTSYHTRMTNRRGGSSPDLTMVKNAVRQFVDLRRTVWQVQPDVALLFLGPGSSFYRDLLLIRRCRHLGVPTVIRFFGGLLTEQMQTMPSGLRRLVIQELSRANAFLMETTDMLETLKGYCPHVPAYRVPNFITKVDLPQPSTKPKSDSEIKVIYFGNMTPTKGVETILQSVDKVCDQLPAEFHFVGGELHAGYLNHFRSLAAGLRHASSVHVHGRLPREETHALANDCDIFAFPTSWQGEGQPAALIEAMGMGLVPIATRWRAIPEIVMNSCNGLLMDAPCPTELSAKIVRLASDVAYRSWLSQNARETVLNGYEATPALLQYHEILNEVFRR